MAFLIGPRNRQSESLPAVALASQRTPLTSLLREWSRDWGGLLTIALTAYVVLFVAWLFVRWPFGEHIVLIDNLAFLPVSLVAGVLAWRAASRRNLDARTRRAWLILGIAFIAYWAGDALWLYYENILGSAPFPSWADAGYLTFYPLVFLGLLLFPTAPRGGGQVLKFWLDSMTVLLGGRDGHLVPPPASHCAGGGQHGAADDPFACVPRWGPRAAIRDHEHCAAQTTRGK